MSDLKYYIKNINNIFQQENNRYKAHELCKPLLKEMANNSSILFEIVKKNLQKPAFFLQKRINPVIALDIEINETISFVAHCWMPLPDKQSDITHQSIHHHGKLLLTSVAAYGIGYESIIFKKEYSINKESGETFMQIDKIYKNPFLNIEFIDINTPHVVFYPSEFSITYAIWTNVESSTSENLKKLGLINKYKKQLRKLIDFFGAAKLMGLNTNEYLDFYPKDDKIMAMKSRVMYPEGSNSSFVKGVFSMLQTIQYNDIDSVKNAINSLPPKKIAELLKIADSFQKKETMLDDFEKKHLNIEYINFKKNALAKVLNF